MAQVELKVPDIGDYDGVPVIELLVAVGDSVAKDQGLVTLESDKATMEVPASQAGVIRELKVKVGDTVAEGSVVAILESEAAGSAPAPSAPPAKAEAPKPPVAPSPAAPAAPTPKSPAWATSSITAAACSSALDGMQPTLRQTPPRLA